MAFWSEKQQKSSQNKLNGLFSPKWGSFSRKKGKTAKKIAILHFFRPLFSDFLYDTFRQGKKPPVAQKRSAFSAAQLRGNAGAASFNMASTELKVIGLVMFHVEHIEKHSCLKNRQLF